MIFFAYKSLERAVREYVEHAERNHQGLGNQRIEPGEDVGSTAGHIACRERLGGMLKFYHRRAAYTALKLNKLWPDCAEDPLRSQADT